MTDNQRDIILDKNPNLESFIRKNDHGNHIFTGKKCWFLDGYKCEIHSTHGEKNKPLTCQIYPLKFRKLNSDIIVAEYIPCPNFEIVNYGGIDHSSKEEKFFEYYDYISLRDEKQSIDLDRINMESEFRDEFDSKFEEYSEILYDKFNWLNLSDKQQDMALKLFWLYPQVRMQKQILSLPFKWSLNTMEIYAELICDVSMYFNSNIQNVYAVLLNKFLDALIEGKHILS